MAPDADWASVREQRSSSNALDPPRRGRWGPPWGAGIPARGPGRLPLENDDFGSVSGHLAQLAWSSPRRPPGGGGFRRPAPTTTALPSGDLGTTDPRILRPDYALDGTEAQRWPWARPFWFTRTSVDAPPVVSLPFHGIHPAARLPRRFVRVKPGPPQRHPPPLRRRYSKPCPAKRRAFCAVNACVKAPNYPRYSKP